MNNLHVLPIWKKDASVADRFAEMASYARAQPERFDKFVMCFTEKLPNGNTKYRTMTHNCELNAMVGMFEIGKAQALAECE